MRRKLTDLRRKERARETERMEGDKKEEGWEALRKVLA